MIDSPCIRNCCLDEEDICLGCHRHLEEICGWQKYTESEKQNVLDKAKARADKRAKTREAFLKDNTTKKDNGKTLPPNTKP